MNLCKMLKKNSLVLKSTLNEILFSNSVKYGIEMALHNISDSVIRDERCLVNIYSRGDVEKVSSY